MNSKAIHQSIGQVIRFAALLICCIFSFLGAAAASVAGQEVAMEYKVKAAFIYNFTQFVSWPDSAFSSAADPIKICILGDDPFQSAIDPVSAKKANNRAISISRYPKADSIDRLRSCQVIYLCPTGGIDAEKVIEQLASVPVLFVCDGSCNGTINLVLQGESVRFEIDLSRARGAGLTISSQLLKLAVKVQQ